MKSRVAQSRINGSRGGRPPKGEVKWEDGRWMGRVIFSDGARRWIRLDPEIPPDDEERARSLTIDAQRRIRGQGLVLAEETVSEWHDRYLAFRDRRGYTTVADTRSRARRILAVIGHKDVLHVTRDDVEDIRDRLDAEVRAGAISWKTAAHTWSDLRCMMRHMANSKDRSLRVRRDDPSSGVEPPDTGAAKGKTILLPDEFQALLLCEDVPYAYRVVYAIAVYTGLRAGELEALQVRDVDVDHAFIHVDKAVNRKTGRVGPAKHEHVGNVPIEPHLRPLLAALTHKRAADDRLVWMPVDEDRAAKLRSHLLSAGVARPTLHDADARNKRLTFHDLRSTHLTWRACRGDAPTLLQAVGRHESFATTLTYIHRATLLQELGSRVFAALPADLLELASGFVRVLDSGPWDPRKNRENHPAFWRRPQRELNPCYRRERPVS